MTNSANNSNISQQVPFAQPSQQPSSPMEFLGNSTAQATTQTVSSAPQFDFDYQSQSPASIGSQGTEILTLDTQSLFKLIEKAHSLINAYMEAKNEYEAYQGIKNWCDYVGTLRRVLVKNIDSPEGYGVSEEDIETYNEAKGILTTFTGKLMMVFGSQATDGAMYSPLDRAKMFAKRAMKQELPADLQNAGNSFKNAEQNLNNEIETIRTIPPAYRSPTALKTIMFYLSNLRAKTWNEAANQFDMQVSTWKLNSSEEFQTMQLEAHFLTDQSTVSSAISSELFSGLSHFVQ